MGLQRKNGARLLASVAAVGLIATACSTGEDDPPGDEITPEEQPTDVRTSPAVREASCGTSDLVWVHEVEPSSMHLDEPGQGLPITSWIRQSLWEGLYGVTTSMEFFPELLAEELEVTSNDDGSVTFGGTLRDGLTWSDGTPVTAQQVVDTWTIIMEGVDPETGDGGVYRIADRRGYDLITGMEASSATEFTFTMSEFFAGYRALFQEIFPTHVTPDAATANAAFPEFTADGEPLPSTGPMLWDTWDKGSSLHLVTNEDYHGSVSPDVERQGESACVTGVDVRFVADTAAQIEAVTGGGVDIIFTQPQTQFERAFVDNEDFTVATEPGAVFEHWGLNLRDTHLQDPLVREAIALAMDKSEVVGDLFTPLFGDVLPAEGLGNTYLMPDQPAYEDHAGDAGYGAGDVDGAIAKLEEAGYSLNGDGVMEHPERGVLTLRVGTTGGDKLRELQQQRLQAQLLEAGVELTIDNVTGGAYLGEVPFAPAAMACATGTADGETVAVAEETVTADCDRWDIAQFAWIGGPWPGGNSDAARCGSGVNPYGYCNETFDQRSLECDRTIDEAERAACYNELDTYLTTLGPDGDGLFMLPITQEPSFFAYSHVRLVAAAVSPDANAAGPLVNVVDYEPAA